MINAQTIRGIAKLARLEVSESETEKYTQQLGQILNFMEKLDELPTDGVQATSHAFDLSQPLREDVAIESKVVNDLFKVSPDHEENFFRVPRVL